MQTIISYSLQEVSESKSGEFPVQISASQLQINRYCFFDQYI